MKQPNYSAQNLICMLNQRHGHHSFREGIADISNWFLRAIRWHESLYCCGAKMMMFTGYYLTSGLPDRDCAFYGCRWCGRVE